MGGVETGGSLIDRIRSQVDALTPEQIKEQYAALQARKAKDQVAAKTRRDNRSDEQKEKDKARSKAYLQTDAAKARAKAYRERDDIKEKTKEREKARRAVNAAILAKAKELGIDGSPAGETPVATETGGQPAATTKKRR